MEFFKVVGIIGLEVGKVLIKLMLGIVFLAAIFGLFIALVIFFATNFLRLFGL